MAQRRTAGACELLAMACMWPELTQGDWHCWGGGAGGGAGGGRMWELAFPMAQLGQGRAQRQQGVPMTPLGQGPSGL